MNDVQGEMRVNTPFLAEAIERLVQRLVEGLKPEKIILFGSYAHGEPTGESDLDVMIIVPESHEPAYRRGQKAYRCVGAIGISKDLLVLTQAEFDAQADVATSLARRARDEGIILYARGKTGRGTKVADQKPA